MSSRIPAVPREELRPDQQEFYDYFRKSVTKNAPHPGAADRAGKTLFPVLAVLPKTGKLSVDMLASIEAEATTLPKDVMETVSLYVTTYFKSPYVTHAHKMMAVKLGALTQQQAENITSGSKPFDLNEQCSLAYDTAHHLLEVRGPLSKDLWDRCDAAFGKEGTVGLVHLTSLMTWTSLGLNAADVKAPQPPPQT
jgi:4-carboxymuconolactone decarboxylase